MMLGIVVIDAQHGVLAEKTLALDKKEHWHN